MPISISKIELKLHQRAFRDLSELEGYFKRMVTNAKEYHPRGSQEYEDAERIRKALSNYMVKTNPAYKNSTTYTATATPIGQEPQPWTGDDQNYDMSGMMDYSSYQPDADTSQPQPMEVDEPAAPATEGEQQAEAEADSEPEAEQEAPTPGRSLRNRSAPTPVVAKKSRRSGRRSTGAAQDEEAPEEASSPAADEADEDAEGEPEENADGAKKGDGYAGLTFQEAQEKIVEETMKKQKEG